MNTTPRILIGCAGWSISSANAVLPGLLREGSQLQRYAAALQAVEINSSFYRPHKPETYARWRDTTPPDFRFAVKMPRSISHEKKLKRTEVELDRFLAEAGTLGDKLGCLLLQLPPRLQFDRPLADDFFRALRQRSDAKLMCEPRHLSWFDDDAEALFEHWNISRVIADPPVAGTAQRPPPAADAVYLRLHGAPRIYWSAYSAAYLHQLCEWIGLQHAAGLTVWCIFDNTAAGAALANAITLDSELKRV